MSKSLKDYLEDDPGLCKLIGREELEKIGGMNKMSIFKRISDNKLRDLDGRIQDPAFDVKKDEELTIENAELALQLLLSGGTSNKVDCIKVACGALRYYIEKEELWKTNHIG